MFIRNIALLGRDCVKHIILLMQHIRARIWYVQREYPSSIHLSVRLDTYPNGGKPFPFKLQRESFIEQGAVINSWIGPVEIGRNSGIGIGSVLIGPVTVGENVRISQNCFISGENRKKDPETGVLLKTDFDVKPVIIEDNVWIGAGAVVLPGVTIGRNTVIGAGSVVTKDIPEASIAVGNPAIVVKSSN